MTRRAAPNRKISVITPCYNAERFIADAIRSILAQTVPIHELIVVDDGSTDGSPNVVAGFGSALRHIRQSNAGAAAARNLGISHCSGDLIAFLDADDLWPADSLALRLERLGADCDLAWVGGSVEQFVSPGSGQAGARPPAPARLAGAMLFRRDAFARIGPFDPAIRLGYMLEWCSRAAAAGLRGGAVGATVLRRRIHDSNSVLDHRRLSQDYLRALRLSVRHSKGATPLPGHE